jgi:hypothetical protein
MARTFPSYVPSARSFKPGEYPVRTYRSQSGVVSKRIYGNKPTNYELQLTFSNVDDSVANDIVAHYEDTAKQLEGFNLPNEVFGGMGNGLKNKIQAPSNITWSYGSPPQIKSVFIDVSTVEVSLIGEINV